MELYFLSIILLILGGIISIFFSEKQKMKLCAFFVGISFILSSISSLFSLFTGQTLNAELYLNEIFGSINFRIDSLSAFFILMIGLMSFLGSIYAIGYIKPYLNKNRNISSHCFFFMLLIMSMLTVVTVQNALFFLIMWEIMSLSSFFLVIFENNKKEVINAGIKYFIYMHVCVIFLILAFAFISIKTNSFDFVDFMRILAENNKLANIVFILFFIGFGTKAGFMPFHNWLPDAHPAAPSHVSGIMSGVMIKTGIYGILRIIFLIGIPTRLIAYTVIVVSTLSALWGVLYAISQHDIKKLLAYHSIENIGIIGMGIGVGLIGIINQNIIVAILGFSGALLHILNHSIFKILLFFAAGNVYLKTHLRNVEFLGGLIKKMPYTGFLFIIGAVAICGLPPFNGFISELLIYAGMVLGLFNSNISSFIILVLVLASLALIGTMAILCFTKVVGVIFLGNPRSENAENVSCDADKVMIFPMIVLAILILLIGIFPHYATLFILSPVLNLLHLSFAPTEVQTLLGFSYLISILCFVFVAIFVFVFVMRFLINKKAKKYLTWGCGYNKPNNKMQYSASSYADLFISTLKPLFKRILHIKKPKDLFPCDAYYEAEIEDIEEAYIVKPLIKFDEKILSKFERIQNGNMQQYILFGLIFLILMIVGLIFVG